MTRLPIPVLLLAALSCGGKASAPAPEAPADPGSADAAALEAIERSVAEAMDPSADPCVDFYQYACGGWEAATELPADKTRMTRSFTTISDQNEAMLKGILEEAARAPGDDPDLRKVGAYYSACMDTEGIDARGMTPVEPTLQAITASEGLWATAARLQLVDVSTLFGLGVSPDFKNPDVNVLGVGQGGLGLPDRAYYLEDRNAEARQAYRDYLVELGTLSGASPESAQADADAVLAFETELARLARPRAELRDPEVSYNPMDREGLQALTPNLDWDAALKAMGYPDIDQFIVETPAYFEGLDALVQETEPAVLAAYLRLHALDSAAPYLAGPFDQAHFGFHGTALRGQKEQRPRWKRCVARTEAALGEVLGRIYVERAFAGDSKAIALDMIRRIEAGFEAGMDELDWMDDPTREVAIAKSRAITNKIGYPDTWRDYSGLEVTADDHFANVLASRTFESHFWLSQAGQPVDKGLWYMTPQQVNAYYNPLANEIAFPAGILQPPFFDRTFPKAMNYGAMGMVMAHEVSHGFDDQGRKFSPTGELTEWWAPEVAERFEARATCVREQFDGYEVQPDLFVNGQLTLGENIADLGGVKQSLRAYRTWREEHGPEPELAGLTNEQLFFVAYAQGWCSLATPEAEAELVQRDPHAPPRFRVNGPLRNLRDFGEAFGCEVGDPLYPPEDEICVVW
jgi:putative endopeptidase